MLHTPAVRTALRHSRTTWGVPINRVAAPRVTLQAIASPRVAFSHRATVRSLSSNPSSSSTPVAAAAVASSASSSTTPVSADDPKYRAGHTWKEVQNHQGRVYFEHLETKERSWDKPNTDSTQTVWTLNDQAWASANADPFDSTEDKKLLPDASFGEKTFDALVNSKTLYWAAFGGAGVFLTVSYFSY